MSVTPKLRFSEYSHSWSASKLGELVTYQKGLAFKSSQYLESGERIVRASDLGKDRIKTSGKLVYFNPMNSSEFEAYNIKKNEVIITTVGSKPNLIESAVGRAILVEEYNAGYLNQNLVKIAANENADIGFIYSNLRRKKYTDHIWKIQRGNANQSNIALVDLLDFSVVCPPLPEQKKIADFLGAVDDKIAGLRERESLLTQYKKGVMQKIFSQELRFKQEARSANGATGKHNDDDGSDFPDWKKRKFGELFKIGSGRDYKHLNSGGVPVFGTGGLMTYVDEFLYDGDSVGIGRKGTIDKPVFLSGKFWTVDTLFYTHSFQGIIPRFLLALFQRENWKKHNEASGVPSLSKSTIESLTAIVPVVEEQQKIADFLSAIDTKITAVSAQITHMQDFKKGLLQQMFV